MIVTVVIVTVVIKMNIAFYALRKLKVLYAVLVQFFYHIVLMVTYSLTRIKNLLPKPGTCMFVRYSYPCDGA
jgi:hypothetical protein